MIYIVPLLGQICMQVLKKHGSFILPCVYFILNINFLFTVVLKEHSSSYINNVTVI